MPCPTVGTVHDFSILHVPNKYDRFRETYIRRVLPRLVSKLTRVLTVSESSRRDIADVSATPASCVQVIPNGADLARFHPGDKGEAREHVRSRLGLKAPYFLYVSRIEHPGKNHIRLIDAFERFRSRNKGAHALVLAGPDWDGAEEVHARAAASPFASDIVFTGFVDDDDLPHLYRAADGVVFPSLYEGFGIPVLEALASGTPVACSDTSSLPEVGGDAVRYFDPTDPTQIAWAMERILVRGGDGVARTRRGVLRAKWFTWTRTARRTLVALEDAAYLGMSQSGAPWRQPLPATGLPDDRVQVRS
jgi:glycosyltransferase involved in cell wall biosynthesis